MLLHPPTLLLALSLASISSLSLAATAGSFADGGKTQVSAMMMFLGNEQKVYILDKAEGNAALVNGHPAWGAVWDVATHQAQVMDVRTNTFCASGAHLPNGSFVTFGGNGAVGPGASLGDQLIDPYSASWDSRYQDFDGRKSIRVLNPCRNSDNFNSANCQWYDNPSVLSMQRRRWYSTAESLGDGTITLIGGMVNGGYINRNVPDTDPVTEGLAAENSFEFFPPKGDPQIFNFLVKTSGLNTYAHAYLMASGRVFLQANISTALWDPNTFQETDLPDMPGGVARVYPASGAVAMLPMTPANNYSQTVLFCGGTDMPAADYGDYSHPVINTWNYPASNDCQRITPEPQDGSSPIYVQDDDMFEGRTMGQFIILPDQTLLVVNGGLNGTAGYSQATGQTPNFGDMPFGESLASGPVGTPAIYNPSAPQGKRWSRSGLATSSIPRLYHSSAILLPDASVLIAGSNPNLDVNLTTVFPTTYQAEIFYPSYFSSSTRPIVSGVPNTISYGGQSFDITISPNSYSGSSNDAADSATVVLQRGGFSTHAMNMGQRLLQLNNTYTVYDNGTITLHVAQAPPNSNLFQPGPALLFVTVQGIPSNGTYVILGSGQVGTQPLSAASDLPANVRSSNPNGGSSNTTTSNSGSTSSHTGIIIGGIVAAIAALGIVVALIAVYRSRRRRPIPRSSPTMKSGGPLATATTTFGMSRDVRNSDSSAFVPLQQDNFSHTWTPSSASFTGPYHDMTPGSPASRPSALGLDDYDPYAHPHTSDPRYRY
ncbi:copper radical oxidase [Amanita muscaria Koide BX008]|uniref:Copper radical oxidase n=1 Tax=Amanita muscaria (strain Koide BX008) TaxID=946122 RepID=A0A0C2T857_AMAMK|nr:copper radical oxidase [Amanita muscaria Koide BX008]